MKNLHICSPVSLNCSHCFEALRYDVASLFRAHLPGEM